MADLVLATDGGGGGGGGGDFKPCGGEASGGELHVNVKRMIVMDASMVSSMLRACVVIR